LATTIWERPRVQSSGYTGCNRAAGGFIEWRPSGRLSRVIVSIVGLYIFIMKLHVT